MNWIPLVATSLLTPLLTGVVVYLLQLRWQEQMEKRLARFSKLHERRAEVIAELYRLLVTIQSSLGYFTFATSDFAEHFKTQDRRESLAAAGKSIRAFWSYYQTHRVHLPRPLVNRIQEFYERSLQALIQARLVESFQPEMEQPGNGFDQGELDEYLEELARLVDEEIPQLREQIEEEFRELLGS